MGASDYRHRYHAGNVGDVWKHCVLVAVLEALSSTAPGVHVIETHAGAGVYKLGATGEWTEGLGRLIDAPLTGAAGRYLEQARALGVWTAEGPRVYPGSPVLALPWLGARGRLECFEVVEEVRDALRRRLDADPRASVTLGDGLSAAPSQAAAALAGGAGEVLVHVDPPYSDRDEWRAVVTTLAQVWAAAPDARCMLWYPVKSLTRPNTLLAALQEAGVPGVALELITTPLELRRNRLNGSGVVLVRPPEGVVAAACAAMPALGVRCAVVDGRWSSRCQGWGATR